MSDLPSVATIDNNDHSGSASSSDKEVDLRGSREQVREILVDIGIERTSLRGDAQLRADLGLDSTETTQLEIELAERIGVRVDLWDQHDYTVQELADIADETAIIEGPASA